jgi:hypothetical protein
MASQTRRGTRNTVKSPDRRIYKVLFANEGEIFEIYCEGVSQSSLFGFIELEGFLFGEKTQTVIDPAEERLKSLFDAVSRTYVPMHAIVRIDEVEKSGAATVHEAPTDKSGKILTLPSPLYTPGKRR